MKERTRTRFDVMRDIREIDEILSGANSDRDGFVLTSGALIPSVDLQRKKVLLRHELRKMSQTTASGDNVEAIKKYWARQADMERIKQEAEKIQREEDIKRAKERIENEMSIEQLEELIKKKKKVSIDKEEVTSIV
jgi:hypothetical protein